MDNDSRVVMVETMHPKVIVGRGLAGHLLIEQHYGSGNEFMRVVIITEMQHAVAIAKEILRVADESYLNPIKPIMYDDIRKGMN